MTKNTASGNKQLPCVASPIYIRLGRKGLQGDKYASLFGSFPNYICKSFITLAHGLFLVCEHPSSCFTTFQSKLTLGQYAELFMQFMGCFHNFSFVCKGRSGFNKLECLSLASLYSLVKCYSIAYWAHHQITKKYKFNELRSFFLYNLRMGPISQRVIYLYSVKAC